MEERAFLPKEPVTVKTVTSWDNWQKKGDSEVKVAITCTDTSAPSYRIVWAWPGHCPALSLRSQWSQPEFALILQHTEDSPGHGKQMKSVTLALIYGETVPWLKAQASESESWVMVSSLTRCVVLGEELAHRIPVRKWEGNTYTKHLASTC